MSVFDETGTPSDEYIELEGRRRDGERLTEAEAVLLTKWRRELYLAEGEPVTPVPPMGAYLGAYIDGLLGTLWKSGDAPEVLALIPASKAPGPVVLVEGLVQARIARSGGAQPFVLETVDPWGPSIGAPEVTRTYSDAISRTGQYFWDVLTEGAGG